MNKEDFINLLQDVHKNLVSLENGNRDLDKDWSTTLKKKFLIICLANLYCAFQAYKGYEDNNILVCILFILIPLIFDGFEIINIHSYKELEEYLRQYSYKSEISKIDYAIEFLNSTTEEELNTYLSYKM